MKRIFLVFWFSRQREFRADTGGARLAGKRQMIGALEQLKSAYDEPHLPDQMRAFGLSGGTRRGLMRLFMTHPSLDERIQALQRQP